MDIHEVARAAGVPASTIRFYEEKGLVRSIGRRGLRRLFEPSVVERLALIGLGRAAGFTLEEIAAMFAPGARPRVDRARLSAKADELDARIARLTKMRDGLRHAAACKAPSHLECPSFQRLLRAVTSGALRAEAPRARRRPGGAAADARARAASGR
ncbi:MAG: helix-turn-helix domain-containing protein [Myxococcales bacterium]|nr:helix-turn-helix domain-containing protein [Myxococcales bacterium]